MSHQVPGGGGDQEGAQGSLPTFLWLPSGVSFWVCTLQKAKQEAQVDPRTHQGHHRQEAAELGLGTGVFCSPGLAMG